jgi:hypothetical protein
MTRTNRIAILAALALLVVAAGTVFATRAPQAERQPAGNLQDEDEEAAPDAEAIQHAIDRLDENEIAVDEGVFTDLAGRYGLGGAVRLSAWASQTGMPVDELAAMRDSGGTDGAPMGWGRLAKDLRDQGFDVRPGVGSIMGGGRGPGEDPPGQERNSSDD